MLCSSSAFATTVGPDGCTNSSVKHWYVGEDDDEQRGLKVVARSYDRELRENWIVTQRFVTLT